MKLEVRENMYVRTKDGIILKVNDIEAEQLEKIADDNDTNVAEIVEMLFEYVEDMKRDNNLR